MYCVTYRKYVEPFWSKSYKLFTQYDMACEFADTLNKQSDDEAIALVWELGASRT